MFLTYISKTTFIELIGKIPDVPEIILNTIIFATWKVANETLVNKKNFNAILKNFFSVL